MKNPVSKLLKKLFRKKKNKVEKGKKYEELSESVNTNSTFYAKNEITAEKTKENDYSEYKATKKTVAPQPPVAGFDDITWLTKSNRESRESLAPGEIVKKALEDEQKEEEPIIYRQNKRIEAKSISQSVFNVNMVTEKYPVYPAEEVYATFWKEHNGLKPVVERKPTPYKEHYSNPIENYRKAQRTRSPPPKYEVFVRERVPEVRRPRQSMPYGGVVQQCKCENHQKANQHHKKSFAAPDMEILLDDAFIRMTIAKKVVRRKRSQVDLAFYESKKAEKQYEAVKSEFLTIRHRRMSMPAGAFEVYGAQRRNQEEKRRNIVRNKDYYDF